MYIMPNICTYEVYIDEYTWVYIHVLLKKVDMQNATRDTHTVSKTSHRFSVFTTVCS